MFCYEWVKVVLCCSGSDGATHRDVLPSHGWGLSALSKSWCYGNSQVGGDQTQFLSLKEMFLGVNFFLQAFPVIPVMLLVYFLCKLWAPVLLCWATEYSSTPGWWGGIVESWMGFAEWGDLGALSKGNTSCFSADKFITWALCAYGKELCPWHRMFLFTICIYLFIYCLYSCRVKYSECHCFFPFWSVIQKDWWKRCPSFLSFDVVHHSLVLSKLPESSVCWSKGTSDNGRDWGDRPGSFLNCSLAFYNEEIYFIFLSHQGMNLKYEVVEKPNSSLLPKIWCLPFLGSCWASHVSALNWCHWFSGAFMAFISPVLSCNHCLELPGVRAHLVLLSWCSYAVSMWISPTTCPAPKCLSFCSLS